MTIRFNQSVEGKMKIVLKRLSICLAAVLFLVLVASAATQNTVTSTGRFQLVPATVWDETTQRDVNRLFKIDTATGKTWEYESYLFTPSGGEKSRTTRISGWTECNENPLEIILKSQKKESK